MSASAAQPGTNLQPSFGNTWPKNRWFETLGYGDSGNPVPSAAPLGPPRGTGASRSGSHAIRSSMPLDGVRLGIVGSGLTSRLLQSSARLHDYRAHCIYDFIRLIDLDEMPRGMYHPVAAAR